MGTVVAIHQPNFFPWLGFFAKAAQADVFILLDHVQFPKTKGNWGNRVQWMVGGAPRWATMPVRRDYHGVRRFDEMLTCSATAWRSDLLRTLRMNYSRAAAFSQSFPTVEPLVLNPSPHLADYNCQAILTLADRLGLGTDRFVRSSSLRCEGQATDLLVSLVRAVGGTAYLSGRGSSGYLEPEQFAAAGLELLYQSFSHPTYPQIAGEAFVPGLSCLDAVFNCGFGVVRSWLNGAATPSRV
jgi:hypothetical protein